MTVGSEVLMRCCYRLLCSVLLLDGEALHSFFSVRWAPNDRWVWGANAMLLSLAMLCASARGRSPSLFLLCKRLTSVGDWSAKGYECIAMSCATGRNTLVHPPLLTVGEMREATRVCRSRFLCAIWIFKADIWGPNFSFERGPDIRFGIRSKNGLVWSFEEWSKPLFL